MELALLPLLVLDAHIDTRRVQLAKVAKGRSLGLGLTDPEAIAACSMGNIRPLAGHDHIVSGRAVHFEPLKSRMRLVIEEVNFDTLMAAALLSMRMDGIGLGAFDKSFDPDARDRSIDLGLLPLWSPATDTGNAYGEPVSNAEAVRQWISREDIPLERRIADLREYLETGEFEGCGRLRHEMQDERYALKVEYRQAVPIAGNRIAVIESAQYRHALKGAAYRADVVVWVNEHASSLDGDFAVRQIVIWQKHAGLVNFAGVLAELAEREAGWVGQATELRSQEGMNSALDVSLILRMLLRHHVDGGRAAREYLDEALDNADLVAAVRDGSSSCGSDLLERVLLHRLLS